MPDERESTQAIARRVLGEHNPGDERAAIFWFATDVRNGLDMLHREMNDARFNALAELLRRAAADGWGAWQRIEECHEFAVPMEFWGRYVDIAGTFHEKTDWLGVKGSFLRIMHAGGPSVSTLVAWGFTHVRKIPEPEPPPCS